MYTMSKINKCPKKSNKLSNKLGNKPSRKPSNKPSKIKCNKLIKKSSSVKIKTLNYKKKNIPKNLKAIVWKEYIGEEIGKDYCCCCGYNTITQLEFHCGHVVAEKHGGRLQLSNLRPICVLCNLSMGSHNMIDFMESQSHNISNFHGSKRKRFWRKIKITAFLLMFIFLSIFYAYKYESDLFFFTNK